MASRGVNILEQSTRECSVDTPLNPGPSAGAGVNNEASTVHLDPSTDESLAESGINSSTRLLDSTHPNYSAIGIPVPANGQAIGPEPTVDESSTNRCCTFMNWYKNTVVSFRSSCFIHIIHVLFTYIPISAIIMGLVFTDHCPQSSTLPIFVIVTGAIGVVFLGFGIAVSCCEHNGTPCSNRQKFALALLFKLLLIIVIIEMCLVYDLHPSYDPSAEDYCNKTFHYFVIGKEIVSATALLLAALIYFPGSSLHACCLNCSAPSPAGAFFHRS